MPDQPLPPNDIVAELDDLLLTQLGGRSRFVRLSRQTAAKQAARHPDVTPADYARLQQVLDGGTAILEKDRTLTCVMELDRGKWWRAVVKRTADRRETLLVTFHRIKPNQAATARRHGRLIRPGKSSERRPEVPKVSSRSRSHGSRSWLGRRKQDTLEPA